MTAIDGLKFCGLARPAARRVPLCGRDAGGLRDESGDEEDNEEGGATAAIAKAPRPAHGSRISPISPPFGWI